MTIPEVIITANEEMAVLNLRYGNYIVAKLKSVKYLSNFINLITDCTQVYHLTATGYNNISGKPIETLFTFLQTGSYNVKAMATCVLR